MDKHIPRLQKYKRNDIVKAIQAEGLDPKEFDIGEDETEAWIGHKLSNARFTIGGDPSKYTGQSVFGDWPPFPYVKYSWGGVMTSLSVWLSDVKHDIETPDLWAEIQSEADLLDAAYREDTDNTPFSTQEKEEINKRLHEFAKYAEVTYSLSEAQTTDLTAKINYLIDATSHLGRKDWLIILIGVLATVILSVALPPDVIHDLLTMVLHGFGSLYGFPELGGS